MAPSKDGGGPKDRIDMIADISKTGKLVEMGCDPFTRAPENKSVFTQTEGSGTKLVVHEGVADSQAKAMEMVLANKDVVKPTDSAASQVLRLVVGMLGMEVHEKPSSWAESWLTFQDQTLSSLCLGSKKSPRKESDLACEAPADWQMRVLQHLRQHVESRIPLATAADGTSSPSQAEDGHDWGPDFVEHLNLADHCLRRITYAVGVLEDPEKNDRPILLREYTEEMVLKVAKDLRQWLEQLGTLLGLYHVHLLDLEAERSKLAKLVEDQQAKFAAGEEERKGAVKKHHCLQERMQEEKMQRDAERLLGIKAAGEDAKIYSQREVDQMFADWEKEHLEPLLQELKEHRLAREGLQDKLKNNKAPRPVAPVEVSEDVAMGKASVALLIGISEALSERVDDDLGRPLFRLSADLAKGGSNLADILAEINSLPCYEDTRQRSKKPAGDESAVKCLDSMSYEFSKLESQLQGPGVDKLGPLVGWARENVNNIRRSILDTSHVQFLPPPQWDLAILNERAQSEAKTDSSGDADAIRREVEAEWELKLKRLREELQAKIRKAGEEAETHKRNAQEALERLADESAKADATLAELRRKIQMMEALLREKGLGKEASDAIWGAGLSAFMQGRDVFERLYQDALDRMRRLAETQARFLEESSSDFLRSVNSVMDPKMKLSGLSTQAQAQSEQSSRAISPQQVSQELSPPNRYVMPRSAGGALPTGTPSRSRSPGTSPPLSPQSQLSSRGVQSAPSKPSDQLSGARLRTSAPVAATTSAVKGQRIDGVCKLHPRAFAQSSLDSTDIGLSISSSGSISGLDRSSRKPASHQPMTLGAPKPRGVPYPPARSGLPDGKMLPPLECKGQGPLPGRDRSRSPSPNDMSMHVEAQISKLRGVRTASPNPLREINFEKERLKHMLSKSDGFKGLSIGSLRPSGSPVPPSPPDVRQERASTAKVSAGRPATHSSGARMARQGGALSMPQLGPPRLLVQSVGAAY